MSPSVIVCYRCPERCSYTTLHRFPTVEAGLAALTGECTPGCTGSGWCNLRSSAGCRRCCASARFAVPPRPRLFVGSGVVEAGCKSLVGQRLKLSGMRWNIPGATAILTLRCHQASDRFDQIWDTTAQPDRHLRHRLTSRPAAQVKINVGIPTNLSHTLPVTLQADLSEPRATVRPAPI